MTLSSIPMPPHISETQGIPSFIEGIVKSKYSNNIYMSKKRENNRDESFLQFGIIIPRIINPENEPPIIKYIAIDDIFALEIHKKGNFIEIDWPDRDEIYRKYIEKKSNLITKAENILINNFSENFISIPKVQNGLNPIKEILVSVFHLGKINQKEIHYRMGKEKGDKYLNFLKNLDFINIVDNEIIPSNEMSKYDLKDITDIEAEKAFFSEVIIRGFRYLHENFHINILTPYLEFANSYYLQTYFTDKLLQLNYTELSYNYNNLYHRSKQKQTYKIFTNLFEL